MHRVMRLTRRSKTVNSLLLPKLLAAQAAYLKDFGRQDIAQFASVLGQELPHRSNSLSCGPDCGFSSSVLLAGGSGHVVTMIGIVSVESHHGAPAWLSNQASSAAGRRLRVGLGVSRSARCSHAADGPLL